MAKILSCKNAAIGMSHIVTKNLNFEVNEGDYLCVLGENGSGKSTLIKTILGLIPTQEGTLVKGEAFHEKEIGYLPQQSDLQKDFPASVEEIVKSGLLNHHGFLPFYTKSEKETAKQIMEQLEIGNLAKKCYRNLSGGQQQRVLLARALCASRNFLLLDEPVTGLDPKVAYQMYELIHSLNKEKHMTVIMVSHDLSAAINYSSHVLHIASQQLFFGTTAEYQNSSVGKAFLQSAGEVPLS